MSRKVIWVAALAVATIAVEFAAVNTADAQLLRRRNRCCAPTTTCTTYCAPARRTPIRTIFASNNNCCCPTTNCAGNCGIAQASYNAPVSTPAYGAPAYGAAAPIYGAPTGAAPCGCASNNIGSFGTTFSPTMTASYQGAPISGCGCGGSIAPVSYESDYMGGTYTGSTIEGCVGEGCGETLYETGDAVIESSQGTSTPVEAPVVADDKEA